MTRIKTIWIILTCVYYIIKNLIITSGIPDNRRLLLVSYVVIMIPAIMKTMVEWEYPLDTTKELVNIVIEGVQMTITAEVTKEGDEYEIHTHTSIVQI